MFEFNRTTKAVSYPIITREYKDILFDDEPILYCGKNSFGNWILGSSIDEDFEKKIDWHFHAVVYFDLLSKFFKRELSYLEVMKKTSDLFILEKAFDNSYMKAFPIDFEDIPKDYLPTEDSLCPSYSCQLYPNLTHRIHLEGFEAAKHRVLTSIFSNIANKTEAFVENGISLIKSMGLKGKTYIQATNPASFEIVLNTELEYPGNSAGFLTDYNKDLENKISILLDKYLGYCISKLPDSIDIIIKKEIPEEAQDIIEEYKQLIGEYHFPVPENYEELFLDKIIDTQEILSDMTEDIGRSYNSIELSGILPIKKIDREDYNRFEKTKEIIQSEIYTEDANLTKYRIHIYQLNTETGKGKAYIIEEDRTPKVSIKIETDEPLEESKYTRSLDKNEIIKVSGKLRRKDDKPKFLEIEPD